MNTASFLDEMNGLKDRPDAQNIENVPAVVEANRLAWNASTRSQGIKALAQLVQQFPSSGNICALYMQALAWDNRVDEALGLASERLDRVAMKSEIASGAGVINLQLGRLREAVLWFLLSAAAQGGGHIQNEHLALELSVIFRALGTRWHNSSLLAASGKLNRIVAGRIRHSNEDKILRLASQSDEELVALMLDAARHLGWITAAPKESDERKGVTVTHRFEATKLRPPNLDRGCRFEDLPTEGRTFVEEQKHGLRMRGARAGVEIRQVISYEDIAQSVGELDACNLYVFEGVTHAVFRMAACQRSGWVADVSDGVCQDKVSIDCVFRPMPTFPILGLMFRFPFTRGMKYYENIPQITNTDVKESLLNISEKGSGKILLFLDPPCRLAAQGVFHLAAPQKFRQCLDQAADHYFGLPETSLDFARAASQYREMAPMPRDD